MQVKRMAGSFFHLSCNEDEVKVMLVDQEKHVGAP